MSSTKITTPVKVDGEVTHQFGELTLVFRDGEASYDGEISDGLKSYLLMNGYGLGSTKAKAPEAPDTEPADPRKVDAVQQVGTDLRDAAVDPEDSDFLAPTNAGKANPHGPEVVSPGIHGNEGVRPVKAANVTFEGDTDAQDKAETAHAAAATDGTPVTLTPEEKDLLGLGADDEATGAEETISTIATGSDAGNATEVPKAKAEDTSVAHEAQVLASMPESTRKVAAKRAVTTKKTAAKKTAKKS